MRVRAFCAAVFLIAAFAAPARAQGPEVLPGWELYLHDGTRTWFDLDQNGPLPPTYFAGVPIGSYDFGSGRVDIGQTDTIYKRIGTATPASSRVEIRVERMQLVGREATIPLFLTLQSDRGRNLLDPPSCCASVGVLDIFFSPVELGGTATGTLTLKLDVRSESLDGPIISSFTASTPLGSSTVEVMFNPKEYTLTKSTPWKHHDIQGLDSPTVGFTSGEVLRDSAALRIRGVNHMLNERDTDGDVHFGCPRLPC